MDSHPQITLLAQAASRFGVAASQLSPLTGGNFAQVYEWAQDRQGRVLKIAPTTGDDDLQSQRAILNWLAFLAAHEAPVMCPVYSPQGNLSR